MIGTEATIRSGIYTREMQKLRPDIEVIGKPCPLFVPLVEEGLFHDSVTDEIASRYLSSLKEKYIDTLVMGCTALSAAAFDAAPADGRRGNFGKSGI